MRFRGGRSGCACDICLNRAPRRGGGGLVCSRAEPVSVDPGGKNRDREAFAAMMHDLCHQIAAISTTACGWCRNRASMPVTSSTRSSYRLQGQKTIAFEVIEALGDAPDYHALPVGNAGNISAHWMGYSEAVGKNTASCSQCDGDCRYLAKPIATQRPIMLGYQAAGAAPFLRGAMVDEPETIARNPHGHRYSGNGVGGKERIRRLVQRMYRRRDPAGTETPRRKRRNFLRTGGGGFGCRRAEGPRTWRDRRGRDNCLHIDRPRTEGPRQRDRSEYKAGRGGCHSCGDRTRDRRELTKS